MLGKAEKSFGDRGFEGDLFVRSNGRDSDASEGGNKRKAAKSTTSAKPLIATAIQRIFFDLSDI
jgi:hypothetical protein